MEASKEGFKEDFYEDFKEDVRQLYNKFKREKVRVLQRA